MLLLIVLEDGLSACITFPYIASIVAVYVPLSGCIADVRMSAFAMSALLCFLTYFSVWCSLVAFGDNLVELYFLCQFSWV